MFYDEYIRLCNSISKSPTAVAKEMGFAGAHVTKWKKGSTPTDATVFKICDYFNLPHDYFSTEKQKEKKPTPTISLENKEIDTMTKGERIKAAREAAGLSQTELAIATNTSKQTMYKYESDVITNIPSDKIQSIASTLHISPSYLMGWTEDPTPEVEKDPNDSFVILSRKAKKLTPEQQARLLEMASLMFEEEFKG